jgi:beta-glucanase (GH16 family)
MKYSSILSLAFLSVWFLSCGGSDDNNPTFIPPTNNDQNTNTTDEPCDQNTITGTGDNQTLVWSDEFDGEGSPDSCYWTIETGTGVNGWGNWESQYYLEDNIEVSDGTLKIRAKKEQVASSQYTSGRMKTLDSYSFTYGRVDVRAKLPASQGTWPAIWMLGDTFPSLGWPHCGEIDIMEQTGANKNKVLATTHWYSNGNASYPNRSNPSSSNVGVGEKAVTNADTEFHEYSLEWTPTKIKWLIDDVQYHEFNTIDPFNADFFIILNVAMGGTLGGAIDPNFTEDVMEIDYIRVYQ